MAGTPLGGARKGQRPPKEPSNFCLGHPFLAKALGLYFHCGAHSAHSWGKPSMPPHLPHPHYSQAALLMYPYLPLLHPIL